MDKKPFLFRLFSLRERPEFAKNFWIAVAVFLVVALLLASCRWRFPFSIETGL